MRLLLDTSALLRWSEDGTKIGRTAATAIADRQNTIFVSAASAWEIGIKRAIGKLIVAGEVRDWLGTGGFVELPVTVEHGTVAGALPLHHRDPFDRMLVAQAKVESLTLVTHDQTLRRYDIAVLDARA
jgi:PIN domain nuclease of toxin-antitoxin system